MTPSNDRLTSAAAVASLNELTVNPFILVGPLGGGRTGATAVRDRDGRPFVLKWEHDREHQALRHAGVARAERLRCRARWPVPRQDTYEAAGVLFVVQEMLPGRPVTRYTTGLVDELLELHERRTNLAAPSDLDWADELVHTLAVGGRSYCCHDSLRDWNERTCRLVRRIEDFGRTLDRRDLHGRDLVHGDLHRGNLLHIDGRISAVVDLDYARVGDARFDLTTMALDSIVSPTDPAVTGRLVRMGIDDVPEPRRTAFLAHLLLRFLDWSIRTSDGEVDDWTTVAERLLPPA